MSSLTSFHIAIKVEDKSCKNRDRYSQETSGSAKGQLRVSTLPVSSARANPLVSDVSAFKVSKNAEKLQENLADRTSGCTSESLSALYPSNILGVKSEPMESTTYNLFDPHLGSLSSDVRVVEAKSEVINAPSVDILDLMPLSERMMMLTSTVASVLEPARKSRCFKETRVHAVTGRDSVDSLKLKSETSTRRRKRKKTATDSAEIALEEDAPGLLQGLLDKGINLDEIKLYGCEEDNDVLDCASDENSFEDLEGVISKIFSKRSNSLLKLNPLRPGKGTKAVYCLACLISLIEQARYLQFRNCPVEWGWCRDLQSFIFVFEMHNRIVLERPEYGYATYFFELVESLPIDWQIKRLVTAMKLTSCSRVTLIENKPLLVGSDISEGEARVLEDYGWRPNCGLGSMLNYCDRVVHDRSHERNTSDWRAKIGKLLMDGYDGGRIVQADLPRKSWISTQKSSWRVDPDVNPSPSFLPWGVS
ncbi:unnamed protein product [Spirodela intermedia]|uniref:Uncharacterized protein n=1 Tax=Spirodela intermedia TaxID=51605 RepID=A0A7I8INC2_SPIIN|nr:unnamed protein product [Spirodela intermedia]CAA6658648.1 unnamed protein product [Spirodela intermedia]